jgi:hypothetical protein
LAVVATTWRLGYGSVEVEVETRVEWLGSDGVEASLRHGPRLKTLEDILECTVAAFYFFQDFFSKSFKY